MSKKLDELRKNNEFLSLLGTMTDSELALKYNVSHFFVMRTRQESKIAAKREHYYPDDIEKYAGKMTDKKAAEILNCDVARVFNYRLENNIEPFRSSKATERRESIVEDYEELGTLQKVADKHGITRERVRQLLNKAGYKKRFYNFTTREK